MRLDDDAMPPDAFTRPSADVLNDHLRRGGRIMVATYGHATVYGPKHAGWFKARKDGCLAVRYGRGWNCLSMSNGNLMVAIRFSALSR